MIDRDVASSSEPDTPLSYGALALAMLATAALGLFQLGELSFWLDEATSWFVAQLDWLEPWRAIRVEGALYMSLYFALLGPWLAVGDSEFAIRSFSVLWAVLTVPVVYAIGRELFNSRAAALGALLLSANAFFIQFAQEARSYTLLLFLTSAATYLLVRGARDSRWLWWIGYSVVAAASLYTHIFAGFVMVAHFVAILIGQPAGVRWRLLAALTATGALTAPLLLALATDSGSGLAWIGQPDLDELGIVWSRLTGQGTILPLMYGTLVAAFGWQAVRSRHDRVVLWRYLLVLAGVIVPLGCAYLLSHIKPMFQDRYLIVAMPFIALAGGAALAATTSRLLMSATLTALLILHLQATAGYFENYQKEGWRDVAAYVLRHQEPDDGIIFYSAYTRQPFEYYVETGDAALRAPRPIYPTPPWGAFGPGRSDGEPLVDGLHSGAEAKRVWLVLAHAWKGADRDTIERWLADGYHQRSTATFADNVTLQLFERHVGPDEPSVVLQPRSLTAQWGDTVTLEIRASGAPRLRYAWRLDGAVVENSYDPQFVLAPVRPENDRSRLGCTVSNKHGRADCASATIQVIPPQAVYEVSPPRTWQPAESRVYQVAVTNTGRGAWRAEGPGMVRLGIHFGGASDRPGVGWVTDQRIALPHDVSPGERVRLESLVTSPQEPGAYVLRHRLVVEDVEWFEQIEAAEVDVRRDTSPAVLLLTGFGAIVCMGSAVAWIRGRWERS